MTKLINKLMTKRTESSESLRKIKSKSILILNNGMAFIRNLGLIIHEMKGILFAYKISSDDSAIQGYKWLETYQEDNNLHFIVSQDNTHVKILSPQKDFAFGTEKQIVSDMPQFRFQDQNSVKLRKLAYFESVKSEKFLVIGTYSHEERFKEILLPAPPETEEESISQEAVSIIDSTQ